MKTVILIILFSSLIAAQSNSIKREFRAVWIASVTNIDWPSSKYLSPTNQRNEFISILDKHQQNKMNAVIVQIRPSCDAFYPSTIEPWSEWLNGTQGTAPNPYYDPLAFMINETKKRGMEFHAWFNPYRAVVNTNSSSVHSSHISVTHPEWIVTYGTLKVLNPGIPAVRDYVTSVIMDVVRRYDIDAVHFDDYFYPYPQSGQTFNDDSTFAQYPNGFTNKSDWRRDNVNRLVKMISDSIKSVKPYVKFGISPFGIWANSSSNPAGSATSGLQSYYEIYCDSRKWIQEGWLDYILPQIYWSIGYSPAKYEVLVPWWANTNTIRHFYVGHAAYKIGTTSDPNWTNYNQIPNQIILNRNNPKVHGSCFFSSRSITYNLGGVQDSLRNNYYSNPALIHPMKWIDSIPPLPPVNLQANGNGTIVNLTWQKPGTALDGDLPKYFVIYRSEYPDNIDLNNSIFIRKITVNDTTAFTDNVVSGKGYRYAVTSVDRIHNESEPLEILYNVSGIEYMYNFQFALEQNYPNPFNPETIINFTIPYEGFVKLKVYDLLGREVAELANDIKPGGKHSIIFDASLLPSGVYFYKLSFGNYISVKKLSIIK